MGSKPNRTFEEIPDSFTRWGGGENPVPGRRCEVIFRLNNTLSRHSLPSQNWMWKHSEAEKYAGGDVIAYRVTS